MEIQSLGQQTLTSPFITRFRSFSKFYGQTTVAQPKFYFVSKALLPDRAETVQWSIGYCKNMCLGEQEALQSWAFSSFRRRSLKTRRKGLFLALKNGDQSIPEEDNPEENNQSDSTLPAQNEDWRDFRARLVAAERVVKSEKDDFGIGSETDSSSISLGAKWAHPLHEPECGCVLVATEKLDGSQSFERTVILLFRVDSEGPFGVILNRPLQMSVNDRKPTHPDMATVFADCPLHFGGPLEASMFLIMPEDKSAVSDVFEEVIPGLYYGARDTLHHAAELVRGKVLLPQSFGFFHGYCGWELDQLKEEIDLDYWYVAACSPNLITSAASASSSDLWEEILQLMGDEYAELSRKPKQDNV